jgi:hypothetical protein
LRRPLVVAGLLLAVAAAWTVERLVVTDREAIEALLSETADAAKRGDWAAVRRALVEDFQGMEADEVVSWIRGFAGAGVFPGWSLSVEDVAVEGDRAAARATVRLGPYGSYSGEAGLERTEAGWRVRSIAPDDPRLLRSRRPG